MTPVSLLLPQIRLNTVRFRPTREQQTEVGLGSIENRDATFDQTFMDTMARYDLSQHLPKLQPRLF